MDAIAAMPRAAAWIESLRPSWFDRLTMRALAMLACSACFSSA